MKNDVRVEEFYEGGGMEAAKAILKKKGIALIAVGSLACVRSLYFTAKEQGGLDKLFWRVLTRQDYSLGRHENAVRACAQEALERPWIRGVIVYASCMDILTGLDMDAVVEDLNNPRGIPVEVLYRGPLVKRKAPPLEALSRIWEKWGIQENPGQYEENGGMLREKKEMPEEIPPAPEFEEIIASLSQKDCDILLLTPGGCKSCMTCQKEKTFLHVKNTRFTDLSIWNPDPEALAEQVFQSFPADRPLYVLDSIVMEAIGFDAEEFCSLFKSYGKEVVYIKNKAL